MLRLYKWLLRRQGVDTSRPIPMLQILHVSHDGRIIACSVAVDGAARLLFPAFVKEFKKELTARRSIIGDHSVVASHESCVVLLDWPYNMGLPFDEAARAAATTIGLALTYAPTLSHEEAMSNSLEFFVIDDPQD